MKYGTDKHKDGFFERARDWALNNRRTLLIALFVSVMAFAVTQFKDIVIIAVLMSIGAISTFYKRFAHIPLGFELVIFTTVTCSIFYGPLLGAIFGAVTMFLSSVAAKEIDPGAFVSLAAAALIGVIPYFLIKLNPGFSIILIGLGMTLLNDLITQPFAIMMVGEHEQKIKSLLFISTHLFFNYIIFRFFAPILRILLGLQ